MLRFDNINISKVVFGVKVFLFVLSLYVFLAISVFLWQTLSQNPCNSESFQGRSTALSRNVRASSVDFEHIWDFQVSWIPDSGLGILNDMTVFSDTDCDQIVAVNTSSGNVDWIYEAKRPHRVVVDSDQDRIYVDALTAHNRLLLALNNKGNKVWANESLPIRGMTEQHILPNSDMFAYASPLGFVPVDPATGVFGHAIPYPDISPILPLVSGEHFWRLFNQQLTAWNIYDNSIIWESTYQEITQWPLKQIETVDGYLLAQVGGDLIIVDQNEGTLIWQLSNSPIISNIAVYGKQVVFLDLDANLNFVNSRNGEVTERITFDSPKGEARDTANGFGLSLLAISEDYVIIYFGDSSVVSAYRVDMDSLS